MPALLVCGRVANLRPQTECGGGPGGGYEGPRRGPRPSVPRYSPPAISQGPPVSASYPVRTLTFRHQLSVVGSQDGPAETARFYNPSDVAVAPDGAIDVADVCNHRIRKITPDGIVITPSRERCAGQGTKRSGTKRSSNGTALLMVSESVLPWRT
ncbi:MAG: hypothetical protein OXG95_07615 [Chloroflexi bacterium]|nr:hypothetical protein [Chloroflexota bacterium]